MGEPKAAGLPEFSVLLPVYHGDDAAFVRAAYRSVTTGQQLPPTYVLVVRDGPVDANLEAVLEDMETDAGTTVVRLPQNLGLTNALNVGLAQASTDIVARADADDICLPERFATQIPVIAAGADITGSAIAEFESDPDVRVNVRHVETDPDRLRRHARFESPFHHPSVVYRRSAVLRAGGYREMPLLEDYLLWANLILSGASVANCAEVLVCYRVGSGAYKRRGGMRLFRSELALQKEFRRIGFTSRTQWLRNVVVRGAYRLIPVGLRRLLYGQRLKQRGSNVGRGEL